MFEIARANTTIMVRNIEAEFAIADMFPAGDTAWSAAAAKAAKLIVAHFKNDASKATP